MENEEIKQVIETAVTNAVSELYQGIEELKAPPPPELTPEEVFQQNISNSVTQWIEDKKTDRYGGRSLDYKRDDTQTGAGKDI